MSLLFLFPVLQIGAWLVLIHLDIGGNKENAPAASVAEPVEEYYEPKAA